MSSSHFEVLVQKAMAECGSSLLNLSVGEAQECAFVHKHGVLQGRNSGLAQALALYKQAMKADSEEDLG